MKFDGNRHTVTTLEKPRMFHEKVLGFEPGAAYEPTRRQAYKVQDGVFFAIGEPPSSTDEIPFTVSDIEAFWERIKDDVEIVYPLEKTSWGTYRFVKRDPDGPLLAFGQQYPIWSDV